MKKLLYTSLAFTALIAGPASAADLVRPAYKRPVAVVAPVYTWTGFYVGLNAGAAIGHASEDPILSAPSCDNPGGCPPIVALMSTGQGMNSSVFTGGAQAGFNYQAGRLVLGWEVDVNYLPLRPSFAFGPIQPSAFPITGTSSGSVKTDWLVTVRPRAGMAFDRFLAYVTGGLAVADERNSLTDVLVTHGLQPGVIGTFNASSSRDVGWVVGGGLEYAFSNVLSAKAEYLYLDFGNVTEQAGVVGGIGGMENASVSVTSHLTAHVVRVGLNYKFGNY